VITGDIATADTLVDSLGWIADIVRRPLYVVLGNHDHYGGSVARVRDAVIALAEQREEIRWLPRAGAITLDDGVALVGVDGWADGRLGDAAGTPLVLNDDRLIEEIAAQQSRAAKLAVKRALAQADAERLRVLLERAVGGARSIVIATHVPPFAEVLPKERHLDGPEWLPLLVCGATGEVIRRAARDHPDHRYLVLAGHTHVAADVSIAANLRCRVAGARYGEPRVTSVEL